MPRQKPRYWILCVYVLFLLIGIPWYWPSDWNQLVLGVPVWVIVAVLISFLASIFTAWLFLFYPTDPPEQNS